MKKLYFAKWKSVHLYFAMSFKNTKMRMENANLEARIPHQMFDIFAA